MKPIFGNIEHIAMNKGPKPNPMLGLHGKYANGVYSCRECEWIRRERYHDRNYYKCHKRGYSRGAGTDHRIGWNACGLFEYRMEGGITTVHLTS